MAKSTKYAKNPALAYRQGQIKGREQGMITVGYFAIRALYNIMDKFIDEDDKEKQLKMFAAFDEELNRLVNDELSKLANGENGDENIEDAVAIVNRLRGELGLERY